MSYRDQRTTNWGCLAAVVVMVPVALIVFLAGTMGGGGCEGREPPCVGNYTPVWIGMGVVVVAGIGLALAINLLVAKVRYWRGERTGD